MNRDWPLVLILLCTSIVIYIYVKATRNGVADLDDLIDVIDDRLISNITLDEAEYHE